MAQPLEDLFCGTNPAGPDIRLALRQQLREIRQVKLALVRVHVEENDRRLSAPGQDDWPPRTFQLLEDRCPPLMLHHLLFFTLKLRFLSSSSVQALVGTASAGTQVCIDARITEPLKREGQARDVVRQVQELRKQANLEMEDRIHLSLQTDSPALRQVIEEHRDYICRETLAVELVLQPLGGHVHRTQVKIDAQPLTIELRKA